MMVVDGEDVYEIGEEDADLMESDQTGRGWTSETIDHIAVLVDDLTWPNPSTDKLNAICEYSTILIVECVLTTPL